MSPSLKAAPRNPMAAVVILWTWAIEAWRSVRSWSIWLVEALRRPDVDEAGEYAQDREERVFHPRDN